MFQFQNTKHVCIRHVALVMHLFQFWRVCMRLVINSLHSQLALLQADNWLYQ
jgi:hypothetical protein